MVRNLNFKTYGEITFKGVIRLATGFPYVIPTKVEIQKNKSKGMDSCLRRNDCVQNCYKHLIPRSLAAGLFIKRFSKLKAEFEAQLTEEVRLNALIAKNLNKVKING